MYFIQKKVAVKRVYEVDGPSVETMFIKEVQSMVQLDHTHIIKLFGISLGTPLMMVGNSVFIYTLTHLITPMHINKLRHGVNNNNRIII